MTDKIAIRLERTGERVATDTAAAIDFIPFHSASRHFFSGKALTVVRAKHAKPGRTTVGVTVKELPPQQVFLTGIH
ncbi:hypothetical protein [Salinimonas sediminis]|uniref:Glycoside hydrolase family 2 domain-containing protein n=1 Tax=Salinimonas sediminis TaxID=2303538 RepID=A0A346NRA0_9ALTE|nr:hypothetical protein [Salinimonas sediminis]AXR08057.1 hypothetical protein D0Y50_17885 [Salinimonas sediminis]